MTSVKSAWSLVARRAKRATKETLFQNVP